MSSNCDFIFHLLFLIVVYCSSVQCQRCPDPSELLPYCMCDEDLGIYITCSGVQNENQLESIFATANFSVTNINVLTFSNNTDLKILTRNIFGRLTFEVIVFQDCAIEYIDEFVFLNSNSTLIQWLMFNCMLLPQGFPFSSMSSYSSLVNLQLYYAGKFDLLPKITSNSLQLLSITNCQITLLHQQAFLNLPNITDITLNDNNISSLPVEMFGYNPLLKNVWLYNNQIEYILQGTFQNLPSLTILALEENRISHIEPGSFLNLPSLDLLHLRGNALSNFLFSNLGVLPALTHLYINSNNIEFLDQDLLFGTPMVNLIAAGYNSLTSIVPGTFDAMKDGKLYLINNSLTTLDEEWLRPLLENGNYMQLSYNPFECGCDAAWLFANDTILTWKITGEISAQCSNGTDIYFLDPSYFTSNC